MNIGLKALALGAAVLSVPAIAQAPAQPQSQSQSRSQPAPPAQSGQAHGDWGVDCQGEGANQVCSAAQSLQAQQPGGQPVALVISRQKTANRYGVIARVPLGFRLDSGMTLRLNQSSEGAVEGLIFTRCVAEGCFAEKPLAAADIARLRGATALEIVFLDFAGNPMVVQMSTRGLSQALAAL